MPNVDLNPVFIVGAGRSGTTLLYRLLSMNEQVGFISNYDSSYPMFSVYNYIFRYLSPGVGMRLNTWFDKDGNAYFADRPWLKKWVPTPKEGEEIYKFCGLSLGSCSHLPSDAVQKKLRNVFEIMQQSKNTPVILSKRTANNRRIPCLMQAFPEAKFIFLVRDGRAVAHSLEKVKWWNEHPLWWQDYQTPRVLVARGGDNLALAARDWIYANKAVTEALADVSATQKLEVRFEDLVKDSYAVSRKMCKFMGVPMTSQFKKSLKKLDLSPKSKSWKDEWSPVQQYMVEEIQDEWLSRFGYK